MRFYHNQEKKALIRRAVDRLGDRPIRVLDLGSGRGGDLWKWMAMEPQKWVGVDIDQDSIDEAKRRVQDSALHSSRDHIVKFFQADLRKKESLHTMLPQHEGLFTIVSCMFALHYFFECPAHFENLMETVCRYTQPKALFCATLFDGDEVRNGFFLDEQGKGVTLTTTHPYRPSRSDSEDDEEWNEHYLDQRDRPPWGQHLWVQNHGGTVVLSEPTLEYRVFVHHFIHMMNQAGFRLISSDAFHPPPYIHEVIRQVSQMNRWYLFEKM